MTPLAGQLASFVPGLQLSKWTPHRLHAGDLHNNNLCPEKFAPLICEQYDRTEKDIIV